jgi:ABC-type glycerol-3-phosphate transport system substrate-binding protein
MKRLCRSVWANTPLLALVVLLCLQTGCSKSPQPVTIRLAGDDWFLKSLTKTGLIAGYEAKTGVRVEVLDRNDRKIMADLDLGTAAGNAGYDIVVMRHRLLGALIQKHQIQPIDSLLADSSVHDASFQPQQQLFPNWWRDLSWYGDKIYGYPYTGLTAYLCYRKDLLDDPEKNAITARSRFLPTGKNICSWPRSSLVLKSISMALIFQANRDWRCGTSG